MTRRTFGVLDLLAFEVVCTPLAAAEPSAERGLWIDFLAFVPPPDPVPPTFPLKAF